MPDSPKCSACVLSGKTGQTIKNWSKRVYKCQDCGAEYPMSYTG